MPARQFDSPLIFSATLVPHRSLGRRGFLLLMGVIGGFWFLPASFLPARRLAGDRIFGLDFLLCGSPSISTTVPRRAYEEVEVSREALVIRKITPRGRARELRFNPAWTRLELTEAADEGLVAMAVRSGGERFPRRLPPPGRPPQLRPRFGSALAQARR